MKSLLIKLVLFSLGGVTVYWLIKETGVQAVLGTLSRLGWSAPLLALPFLCVFALDTLGWQAAFHSGSLKQTGFFALYAIRWAGDSFNLLVPSGHLGGEAVKVFLLKRRGLSAIEATSSVVIAKTLQTLSHAVFISLGAICFHQIRHVEPRVGDAMLVIGAGTFAFSLGLFRLQKNGLFSALFHLLDRYAIDIKRINRRRRSLLRLDLRIRNFYRRNPRQFLICTTAFLLGWLLDPLEIYLASYLLGMPLSIFQAVGIEAFIAVAKGIGFFVPGALGVQETSILFLCRMAGAPDILGVGYAVIRRSREVLFALAGWYWLHTYGVGLGMQRPHVLEAKVNQKTLKDG